mmetsp:Transcript_49930/g.149131  ORF Transcript_49930/g.149131 Transcript_49930/m.149131 type:complete len:89 (+) Transcript_49930:784-1050(+)
MPGRRLARQWSSTSGGLQPLPQEGKLEESDSWGHLCLLGRTSCIRRRQPPERCLPERGLDTQVSHQGPCLGHPAQRAHWIHANCRASA